jgi:predicted metal-dependent phosphoesterase TrpH
MLEHEWRELETLCERLSDLRHRQAHAERSKNVGLCEGLRQDIARAQRQREQLVRHISARLGSAAVHEPASLSRAAPAAANAAPDPAPDPMGESPDTMIGFSR